VWELGSPCGGEIKMTPLFLSVDEITVPICEAHLIEHKIILALFKHGYNIDEMSIQSAEWRKQEFDKLVTAKIATPDEIL